MSKWLGKLLYPKLHPELRRIKLRTLGSSLLIGILISLLFGVVFWIVAQGRFGTTPKFFRGSSGSPATPAPARP